MRLRIALGLALAMLPTVVAGAVALWGWRTVHRPYPAGEVTQRRVEVSPGWDARRVLAELEEAGVIRSAGLARLYLLYRLDDAHLRAGEYLFELPSTTPDALARLVRGDVVTYPVTLIEGLTLEETAATLAGAGFGDLDHFLEAMSDPAAIRDLDPAATDLEGYLFPDTYSFARGTSEAAIVAALVANFRRQLDGALAGRPPEDVRAVVALASIVEKEAQLAEERPLIASVYANRIRRGMLLQADPTVIFALKKAGRWDGNIRRRDLEIDSPYNTYAHPGLPPGPICSPGRASLEAAIAPATSTSLYFVSRNDGSHVFADTLAEHNRNVYEWQKLYWRRRWANERR